MGKKKDKLGKKESHSLNFLDEEIRKLQAELAKTAESSSEDSGDGVSSDEEDEETRVELYVDTKEREEEEESEERGVLVLDGKSLSGLKGLYPFKKGHKDILFMF